jgi:hypothetical protein
MSIDQEVLPEGRRLALQILENFRNELGVDLLPLFDDQLLPAREKLRRARTELFHALCLRGGFDEQAFDIAAVEIEPNLFVTFKKARELSWLTGPAVFQYISTLTSRMEQMSKSAGPESLAHLIIDAGLASVGVSMMRETYVFLRGGQVLQAALRSGITRIGMGSAIGSIVLVLAALVYWLIAINPKKLLGMIINGTLSTLVVNNWRAGVDGGRGGDLFMQHGGMTSFMQDYKEGDLSKLVQINARIDLEAQRYCSAGLFVADKNIGVYGAEGVMILTATDGAYEIAHMFAVPYNKDNGTNVAFVRGPFSDLERLFRELYNNRSTRREIFSTNYHASSTVNDARGGTVGCIVYVGPTSGTDASTPES